MGSRQIFDSTERHVLGRLGYVQSLTKLKRKLSVWFACGTVKFEVHYSEQAVPLDESDLSGIEP